MDRSISLMDGEAVSDGTTTPTPEETEGGVFLSDPTSTSTNGGHFPDTSETTGRDGKTYAYVHYSLPDLGVVANLAIS